MVQHIAHQLQQQGVMLGGGGVRCAQLRDQAAHLLVLRHAFLHDRGIANKLAHFGIEDFLFQARVDFQRAADGFSQGLFDGVLFVDGVLVKGQQHMVMVEADHVGDGGAQLVQSLHGVLSDGCRQEQA